jgi:hypothetical protein
MQGSGTVFNNKCNARFDKKLELYFLTSIINITLHLRKTGTNTFCPL